MTIREYKKKYFICKDDFGKNIYAGDTVELFTPITISTTWTSIVHWNMLYGAWVNIHPGLTILHGSDTAQTELYRLLNQEEWNICDVGSDILISYKGYCKKIKSFHKNNKVE